MPYVRGWDGKGVFHLDKGVLTPNLMIVSFPPPLPMRKSMLSGGSTPRGGLPAKCNRTHLVGGPSFREKIELKGGKQRNKFEHVLLFLYQSRAGKELKSTQQPDDEKLFQEFYSKPGSRMRIISSVSSISKSRNNGTTALVQVAELMQIISYYEVGMRSVYTCED